MDMTMRIEEETWPKRTAGWPFRRLEIVTLPTLAASSFFSHRLKVVTSSSGRESPVKDA
jgi:hypothetical protein